MTLRRILALSLGLLLGVLLIMALAVSALAQPERKQRKKKKNEDKEPVTQVLPVPPDPPGAIAVATGHLVFQVSPLSAKGLLSQQVRDALSAIDKANGRAKLVKLRAFVAGTGDMRRVQAIVSEEFTEKKRPLPAVSTIQVGALPMEGAQVVLEAVSEDRNTVNPNGLAFFSAQRAEDVRQTVGRLQAAVGRTQVKPAGVVRVTCFLSSLDQVSAGRAAVASAFPAAQMNFVQLTRLGLEPMAACEGVGRLEAGPPAGEAVMLAQPEGDLHSAAAALFHTPKIVMTGIQMAFRNEDADIRLAFERLMKAMEPMGVRNRDVLFVSTYALTRAMEERARAMRADYIDKALPGPPAGTSLLFEGLPSLDATMAVEVVAAVR